MCFYSLKQIESYYKKLKFNFKKKTIYLLVHTINFELFAPGESVCIKRYKNTRGIALRISL
jgi:hypothetical protein